MCISEVLCRPDIVLSDQTPVSCIPGMHLSYNLVSIVSKRCEQFPVERKKESLLIEKKGMLSSV